MITSFTFKFLILLKPQFPQKENKHNKFHPHKATMMSKWSNPTKTLGVLKWQTVSQ